MRVIITLFILCFTSLQSQAQEELLAHLDPVTGYSFEKNESLETTELKTNFGNDFLDFLEELFEESDLFEDSKFLWLDYQLFSTIENQTSEITTIVPMVGVHFEKNLFYNIGIRAYLSSQWWENETVLVESTFEEFTELFSHQYWIGGLGGTWHFNVGDIFDPYVGYTFSYRLLHKECKCGTETTQTFSHDFYFGLRLMLGKHFFISGEGGRHSLGFFNAGLGIRF